MKEKKRNAVLGSPEEKEELGLLRAELAVVKAQLASILESRSWRWTKPFRDMADKHPAFLGLCCRFLNTGAKIRRAFRGAAKFFLLTLIAAPLGYFVRRRAIGALATQAPSPIPRPASVFHLQSIDSGEPIQPPMAGGRRIICVTHVLPYPPQAGNEYRIHRMLRWLARQNWNVLLVICPLSNETLKEDQFVEAAKIYRNLIVCQRDGKLLHRLADGGAMLEGLTGRQPRSFSTLLGEAEPAGERQSEALAILRHFCPDVLAELLLHLESEFDPLAIIAEYVFMTRPFTMLRPELFKIVDTIDLFSTTYDKVVRYGVEEGVMLDPRVEAELLNRADLLIAIQSEEADTLRKLAPGRQVISVGVDFAFLNDTPPVAIEPVILLVASDNARNVKGLSDFLRFAWPLIRREVPRAELRVVGSVGKSVETSVPGVRMLGRVQDLSLAYTEARVVINPAVAGTGLKIKTVEALCHLRPIVLWPSGVDGLGPELSGLCHIASNWFDFAMRVVCLAGEQDGAQELIDRRGKLKQQFAPETIYAPLIDALERSQLQQCR
jgi:hypothetical protein